MSFASSFGESRDASLDLACTVVSRQHAIGYSESNPTQRLLRRSEVGSMGHFQSMTQILAPQEGPKRYRAVPRDSR